MATVLISDFRQDLVFVSGGVTKAEAAGGVLGARSGGRRNPDRLQPGDAFQSWQQHRGGKVARPQDTQPD